MNLKAETYNKIISEWNSHNEAGGMTFDIGKYIEVVVKENEEISRGIKALKKQIETTKEKHRFELELLDDELRLRQSKCEHIQTTYTSGYETYSEECDICGLVLRSR